VGALSVANGAVAIQQGYGNMAEGGRRAASKTTTTEAPAKASPAPEGTKPEPKEIRISKSKYPETAQHIEDAQAAGHKTELTIDRNGAAARRGDSLDGHAKVPGKDLDEYPPAMFKEGGQGASVRPISPSDNRGAGAVIGNQCRALPDGSKVTIVVVP
jgi:hypothetical protein